MLLARMAEAVYWAGRYLERAEDTARIVQVHGETHIDLPVGEDVGWAPLIEIAGTAAAYRERTSRLVGSSPAGYELRRSVEARVVAYVLTDRVQSVVHPGVDRRCPGQPPAGAPGGPAVKCGSCATSCGSP